MCLYTLILGFIIRSSPIACGFGIARRKTEIGKQHQRMPSGWKKIIFPHFFPLVIRKALFHLRTFHLISNCKVSHQFGNFMALNFHLKRIFLLFSGSKSEKFLWHRVDTQHCHEMITTNWENARKKFFSSPVQHFSTTRESKVLWKCAQRERARSEWKAPRFSFFFSHFHFMQRINISMRH